MENSTQMSNGISLIIPTYRRRGMLLACLRDYAQQTLDKNYWEIIVCDDCSEDGTLEAVEEFSRHVPYQLRVCSTAQNSGPATARNRASVFAQYGVLAFAGDDCFPDDAFLWQHYISHNRGWGYPLVIQGFTPWHWSIASGEFEAFLLNSGLQASWGNLRNQDGTWKREAPGWFLTTNVSVTKNLFEAESGFPEGHKFAAWEDISLAVKMTKRGVKTIFEPQALNYHFHFQDLDSFVNRQIKEGISRLELCKVHWEVAGDMINPNELREYSDEKFNFVHRLAKEADRLTGDDTREIRYQRWGTCLRMATLKGILQGISERKGLWQALPDLHTSEIVRHVTAAAGDYERGDYMMAIQHAEWALSGNPDNHALLWMKGEIELALGHKAEATACFQESVQSGPGNKLSKARLEELTK